MGNFSFEKKKQEKQVNDLEEILEFSFFHSLTFHSSKDSTNNFEVSAV